VNYTQEAIFATDPRRLKRFVHGLNLERPLKFFKSHKENECNSMDIITIVGLVLTIIGLAATIWQLYLAKNQTDESKNMQNNMESQLQQLESIQKALTTRFIGPFPDYIPRIVSLIENAEKEIIIFCDTPAYGCFTVHNHHVNYRQAIERKIFEKKRVELTFLNEEWRTKTLNEQFPFEGPEWDKLKTDKKPLFEEFIAHYGNKAVLNELTKETFLQLVERLNLRVLNQEFSGKAEEVCAAMPVLFWLVDSREAIFAIPSYERDIAMLGFVTSDQSLISALRDMSKRYRQMYCENPK
jgi:hypothetical protein